MLAISLLIFPLIQAAEHPLAQPQSLFSFEEWKEIYSTRRCPDDFIVLTDGSKLCGTLEKIPAIDYSFGRMEFKLSDIAVICLASHERLYKVQYISRDGQNFIGPWLQGKFTIWIDEPHPKDPDHRIKKEIDPKIVSFILFKERPGLKKKARRRFHP